MDTNSFMRSLVEKGFSFFTGVPDSVLSPISTWLELQNKYTHIIAANEGNAIGMALGHYLGTGKPAVVYMQNSGLGNAVNPITSLAASDVYSIPMLLIVGWRGQPGVHDEPQHKLMGKITCDLLETIHVPYVVGNIDSDPKSLTDEVWRLIEEKSEPAALVLPKGVLSKTGSIPVQASSSLLRETAIETILRLSDPSDLFIATTGKTGRELFEIRVRRHETQRDFLTVGGMGHTSSIALGVALANPGRRVICLDGDGSLIMHMGAMGIIGQVHTSNFVHVLLNNGCHESVGGQPTVANKLDFNAISNACGYAKYIRVDTNENLEKTMINLKNHNGPILLEVVLKKGSRDDLGRPTTTPLENRDAFMRHVQHVETL